VSGSSSIVSTIGAVIVVMALLAGGEAVIPLRARGAWSRRHLGPNLMLMLITFATNAIFNTALVLLLEWQAAARIGVLHAFAPPPLATTAVVVLALDFAYYLAHVAMHSSPALWRYHCVHHSDPAVDVTTTIRQHPGEGVIRYLFLAAAASALGAGPAAFAVYRVWSVVHGLLEHANVRVPQRLDAAVAWVVTTPNMHKVHHSRRPAETNSNYGNIFSLFDRGFSTFTPTARGTSIPYGLEGLDHPSVQTTIGLLALPFRKGSAAGEDDRVVSGSRSS
jgi:sterol desaturase/sphingolipid hydroxylase (fatty acid hydroxylase superfamily)